MQPTDKRANLWMDLLLVALLIALNVAARLLPHYKFGGLVRIDRAAFEEYKQSCRRDATSTTNGRSS